MIGVAANPWVLVAAGLVLAASHGAVAWKSYSLGQDSVYAEKYKLEEVERRVTEAATAASAKEISKIEVKHVTIRQRLDREIIKEPVYTDCRHSPDGMRAVNDALRPPGATEPPRDGRVPGPDGADRR